MYRALIILFIFALSNCVSKMPVIQDTAPDKVVGCDAVKDFQKRMSCISNMITRLEKIENSERVTTIKLEQRYDEYWVVIKYEDCYHDFCRDRYAIEYKPTFWGRLKDDGLKILSGALLGVGIALSF